MHALNDVVRAGYVRYIGMSSCYAWQCEHTFYSTFNLIVQRPFSRQSMQCKVYIYSLSPLHCPDQTYLQTMHLTIIWHLLFRCKTITLSSIAKRSGKCSLLCIILKFHLFHGHLSPVGCWLAPFLSRARGAKQTGMYAILSVPFVGFAYAGLGSLTVMAKQKAQRRSSNGMSINLLSLRY